MSFVLLPLSSAVSAQLMQSNGTQLDKTVMDQAGASGLTSSGFYSLNFSLGQPFGELLSGTGSEVSAGFHSSAGGFKASTFSISIAGLVPRISRNGVLLGLPTSSSVTFRFDKLMLHGLFNKAAGVQLMRDRFGRDLQKLANHSLGYMGVASQEMELRPPSGGWLANSLYEILVSTDAWDWDGRPLSSPIVLRFQTLSRPDQENTVADPSDPQTRVWLASDTLKMPFFLLFNPDPISSRDVGSPEAVRQANQKLDAPKVALREINALDIQNQPIQTAFPRDRVVLSVTYQDGDKNGFVDGLAWARVKKLAWYSLHEDKQVWVRLPSSRVDLSSSTVSASTLHFSVFGVFPQQDLSVSEAYAFPVPFRPHGPQSGSGAGRTGTEAGGITFINLPSRGAVEVYNVRGELLWRQEETDGDGQMVWDVRGLNGDPVASGVYLYIIRSEKEHKVGKLAVVR